MFVLDCSVTLAWCFEEENDERAMKILDMASQVKPIVPSIWSLEVCNVLCMAERHKRITQEDSTIFLELLANLPIEIDMGQTGTFNNRILNLARKHSLTAYDASYLELALRYNISLASFDKKLVAIAQKDGVHIL